MRTSCCRAIAKSTGEQCVQTVKPEQLLCTTHESCFRTNPQWPLVADSEPREEILASISAKKENIPIAKNKEIKPAKEKKPEADNKSAEWLFNTFFATILAFILASVGIFLEQFYLENFDVEYFNLIERIDERGIILLAFSNAIFSMAFIVPIILLFTIAIYGLYIFRKKLIQLLYNSLEVTFSIFSGVLTATWLILYLPTIPIIFLFKQGRWSENLAAFADRWPITPAEFLATCKRTAQMFRKTKLMRRLRARSRIKISRADIFNKKKFVTIGSVVSSITIFVAIILSIVNTFGYKRCSDQYQENLRAGVLTGNSICPEKEAPFPGFGFFTTAMRTPELVYIKTRTGSGNKSVTMSRANCLIGFSCTTRLIEDGIAEKPLLLLGRYGDSHVFYLPGKRGYPVIMPSEDIAAISRTPFATASPSLTQSIRQSLDLMVRDWNTSKRQAQRAVLIDALDSISKSSQHNLNQVQGIACILGADISCDKAAPRHSPPVQWASTGSLTKKLNQSEIQPTSPQTDTILGNLQQIANELTGTNWADGVGVDASLDKRIMQIEGNLSALNTLLAKDGIRILQNNKFSLEPDGEIKLAIVNPDALKVSGTVALEPTKLPLSINQTDLANYATTTGRTIADELAKFLPRGQGSSSSRSIPAQWAGVEVLLPGACKPLDQLPSLGEELAFVSSETENKQEIDRWVSKVLADFKKESESETDQNIRWNIIVVGSADSVGSPLTNLAYSERRAAFAHKRLRDKIKNGTDIPNINNHDIVSFGVGEDYKFSGSLFESPRSVVAKLCRFLPPPKIQTGHLKHQKTQ